MNEFKNLKVPRETHDLLTTRAKRLGMKVYTLADAILLASLQKDDPALREVVAKVQLSVANTQSMLPEDHTNQEPPEE